AARARLWLARQRLLHGHRRGREQWLTVDGETESAAHGCEPRTARRPGARLADRDARRREVPGSALSALAECPAVHPAPPARQRQRDHRTTAAGNQLPAISAVSPPLLSLSLAVAAGRGPLADAGLRSGRQHQSLRRQGGPAAGRGAARLLLPDADALRLAP